MTVYLPAVLISQTANGVTTNIIGDLPAGSTLSDTSITTINAATQVALDNKQPIDADLTAIAALTGTSGFLTKTAADTWALDTTVYSTLALGNSNGTELGTASAGTATTAARSDHVHPTDTTREPAIISGTATQYFRGDKTWATMPVVVNTTANNLYAGTAQLAITATGSTNIAIGSDFLSGSSAGSNNVAIGHKAISTNTGGNYNTAIGSTALKNNTLGSNSVSIGYGSMLANTTGTGNVAIGANALSTGTAINNAVAIGVSAMQSATTNSAVAIGASVLRNNTGTNNVAIGTSACTSNTSGSDIVALGVSALGSNVSGSNSIGIGTTALYGNTSGINNTGIGVLSLRYNTAGSHNTAVGNQALFNNTTGNYNTIYGARAGLDITYGGNNTIIGANYAGTAGLTNNIVLATGDGTARAIFDGTNWTMTGIVNAASFNSTSDSRLKDNITTITNGLEVVNAINPVSFNFKETGDKSYGVIAQEIEAIIADGVVTEREDGYKAVNYSTLIPFLIDAVKTLSAKVDELQSKLDNI